MYFFFKAEDGIRDWSVTGVQTCALPICGCVSMVIRQIPFNIKTFEQLQLPKVIADLSDKPRGLILVTGPTGSGKSTTLAAKIGRASCRERAEGLDGDR